MENTNFGGTNDLSEIKRKPIETAEITTYLRALGARDKKANNPDYMSEHLLGDKYKRLLKIVATPVSVGKVLLEMIRPGAYWFLQARTKYIDDALKNAIDSGITQLVVIGAGFDTRAYRFHEKLNNVEVFEVDLVVTQNEKKKRLVNYVGELPNHVRYVPIDFNKQSLEKVLLDSGYDANKKTLFIWEGVSYYLPQQSVENVLSFVKHRSSDGSLIVFDYVLNSALSGDYSHYGSKSLIERWNELEEPGLFGFDNESSAEQFLNARGFNVVKDIGHSEIGKMYISGKNGKPLGRMYECMRFVLASVKK